MQTEAPTQEVTVQDSVMQPPINLSKRQAYRIRPYDNLLVNLNSYEGNTTGFVNQKEVEGNGNRNINDGFMYVTSYTVDEEGFIHLPVLGPFLVAGMTLREIKEKIDEELVSYIKRPESKVRLANFRVTVLGEVNRPGSQFVYDSKLTLTDALGLAGGMTFFGNAKKVKVVRETDQGLVTGWVDLTNPDFFSSEYYPIYPDDMIYVEPTKARPFHENVKVFSLIVSGLSVGVLVANLIVK